MANMGILFTMPIVAVIDNLGNVATNGTIEFFTAANHAILQTVYQDADLTIPWSNPIDLNAIGEQPSNNMIYLQPNLPYYVEFRDKNGVLLKSFDDYPYPASNTPVIVDQNIENFIANPSFAYYYELPTILPDTVLPIAPGNYTFSKNNQSATDILQFLPFPAGQQTVPGNPPNFLKYVCSVPGSAETYKYIRLDHYDNVATFTNMHMAFDEWLSSTTNSSVEVLIIQNFGTGGSTTVSTTVATYVLNSNWTEFDTFFQIATITGKTIGPGSYVDVVLALPLNAVCTIQVGVTALYESTKLIAFQEVPSNVIYNQSLQSQYPLINFNNLPVFNPADGGYDLGIDQNNFAFTLVPRAGRIVDWGTNQTPEGALSCNGDDYFSAQYYNLAQALYDTTNAMCWGLGPDGFFASLASAVITVTDYSNGAVTTGSAGTSGFTFVQTSAGTSMTQAIATVTAIAAALITPSSYLLINAPTTQYYMWFSLQNQTPDPGAISALAGKQGIKVIYQGNETANQMAILCAKQFYCANFLVPTMQGLFRRAWANGSAYDPDRSTRIALQAGISAAGDNVGSYQANQNKLHNHLSPDGSNFVTFKAPFGAVDGTGSSDSGSNATANSGGNQSNPNNVYVNTIIYY